jgi:hypothetical protein
MKFIDTFYFFLYPAGHLGETDVTFLVVLPFTHVIVIFLTGTVLVAWAGCFTSCAGALKLMANCGEE